MIGLAELHVRAKSGGAYLLALDLPNCTGTVRVHAGRTIHEPEVFSHAGAQHMLFEWNPSEDVEHLLLTTDGEAPTSVKFTCIGPERGILASYGFDAHESEAA